MSGCADCGLVDELLACGRILNEVVLSSCKAAWGHWDKGKYKDKVSRDERRAIPGPAYSEPWALDAVVFFIQGKALRRLTGDATLPGGGRSLQRIAQCLPEDANMGQELLQIPKLLARQPWLAWTLDQKSRRRC